MSNARLYSVVGNHSLGYGVRHRDRYLEYDLLESRSLATLICEILNAGIGPDWEAVEEEIDRRTLAGRVKTAVRRTR